jgi:hypothetical protein
MLLPSNKLYRVAMVAMKGGYLEKTERRVSGIVVWLDQ